MSRMWLTSPYFDWHTLKQFVTMANQCWTACEEGLVHYLVQWWSICWRV
jgi:hypothetical protein